MATWLTLMKNSLTIAGLQHITNNMCADMHLTLSNWKTYFTELKNVEALLSNPDRRSRYVAACLCGSSLDHTKSKFDHFTYYLYEPRWSVVLDFLKQLLPLLPILAATWDARKFTTNVDLTGATRPAQHQAQREHDQRVGIAQFDPAKLTQSLRSAIFFPYTWMCLKLEEIPPKLVAYGEACPCHEPMIRNMVRSQRARVMERHFGKGTRACPASGMLAPELVSGKLEEVAAEAWRDLEAELFMVQPLLKAADLTLDDRALLLADYRSGQPCT